ncbi:MAG: MBL fold metallo-hydrolase [Rhodobacter sp.]|nr:MBL fold metallo-hydrolase [Rhodobacter sp.]
MAAFTTPSWARDQRRDPDRSPKLRFLGAGGNVTGSRYLIEATGRRIPVDCGLFQGFKQLHARNRKPFPVRVNTADTVLLKDTHLDHSGYLPALIRAGFRGRVHCTEATADLCRLILPDSGHIKEEEARYAARKGYSKHKNPKPLYTLKDAKAVLDRFEMNAFDQGIELGDSIATSFIPAGHHLGVGQIRLEVGGRVVHFSGDLGHDPESLMRPTTTFGGTDVLVSESTYGNRSHPETDPEAELTPILKRIFARGGTLLIPSFAVGRAQALMLHIARLMERGDTLHVPLFLSSPVAVDATEIFHRPHAGHHVSREDCEAMFRIAARVNTVGQSKELNTLRRPTVIVSASGMPTGGCILCPLASFGRDRRDTILLSGFRAGGTRGAAWPPVPPTIISSVSNVRLISIPPVSWWRACCRKRPLPVQRMC